MPKRKQTRQEMAIEALKADWPFARRCSFCGVDPNSPTWEDFKHLLENCNNCRVDIQLRGQWRGDGMGFVAALYKAFPDDPRWPRIISTLWKEFDTEEGS